jgi:hypothetical protein
MGETLRIGATLFCLLWVDPLWAQPVDAGPEQPDTAQEKAMQPVGNESAEAAHREETGAEPKQPVARDASEATTAGTHQPAGGKTVKPVSRSESEPLPAPAEPRATDQKPYPMVGNSGPEQPTRNVDLGMDAGIWWRAARGDGPVSYSPALAWGAHARIELLTWLGVRALALSSQHPASVERGGLGPTASTEVDQPPLQVVMLAAQIEPTWLLTPRLRLYTGLGSGWGSIVAPPPEARETQIVSARRSGVLIECWAALGASYDIVADWVTAGLSLGAGLPVNQSGAVFDRVQALPQNPAAQRILYYESLPEFALSLSALASIGLVL